MLNCGQTKMADKKREDKSSDEEESVESAGTTRSCPICGHGNYRYPRGVHTHIQKKHPGYKKMSEMKLKISEACRAEKRKCPNCNSLQSNLNR